MDAFIMGANTLRIFKRVGFPPMRLLICSMPLLALAMLASKYSNDLVKADSARSYIDPRSIAIRQSFKCRDLFEKNPPSIVTAVLEEK